MRVTNPEVSGDFDMQTMMYPETDLSAHAAILLCRPVNSMFDRTEAMLSDRAGKDLVSNTELAFVKKYKIMAYRVNTFCNLRAYNSQLPQPVQPELFFKI